MVDNQGKEFEQKEDLSDKLKRKMATHIEDLVEVGIKVINDEYCTDDIIDVFRRTEDLIEEITQQLTATQQALDSAAEALKEIASGKIPRAIDYGDNKNYFKAIVKYSGKEIAKAALTTISKE